MDLRWYAIAALVFLLLAQELRLSWVREELTTEKAAHEKLKAATMLQNEAVDDMADSGKARDASARDRVDRAVKAAAQPIPAGAGPDALNKFLRDTFS